jgi:hypothetical protein
LPSLGFKTQGGLNQIEVIVMKEFIEVHKLEAKENEDSLISKIEIGSKLTEAEAITEARKAIPIATKGETVKTVTYKHICDHDQTARTGCRLEPVED